MATNITTVQKTIFTKKSKRILIFQQATPPHWGDGDPPSPIHFYEKESFFGSTTLPQSAKLKCPCGGGISCIVDRRRSGDSVMEDEVFRKANCTLRVNCMEPMSESQIKLMKKAWKKNP